MAVESKRSTVELLVLMVTATACAGVLVIAIGIAAIEVFNPETNTSTGVSALSEVLSTLFGAILGLITGLVTGRTVRKKDET